MIDVHYNYSTNGGVDVFIGKVSLDNNYLHTLDKRQEA